MTISGLSVSFPEGEESASYNRPLANCDRSATLLRENEPFARKDTAKRGVSNDKGDLIVDRREMFTGLLVGSLGRVDCGVKTAANATCVTSRAASGQTKVNERACAPAGLASEGARSQ